MSGLHVLVEPELMSRAIRTMAQAGTGPLVLVTHRALAELEHELGDMDAALRFLADVATESGRPVAINLPDGPGRLPHGLSAAARLERGAASGVGRRGA